MEIKEFRKLIINALANKWFTEVEVSITFADIQKEISFKGLSGLYDFVCRQLKEFSKMNLAAGSNLESTSIQYYTILKSQLENFVQDYATNENVDIIKANWNAFLSNYILARNQVFTADSPETSFIRDLELENLTMGTSAFQYLTGQPLSAYNDQVTFTGYMLGYEMKMRDIRKTHNLISYDQRAKKSLEVKFTEAIASAESTLATYLRQSSDNFAESWTSIEDTRKFMSEQFNDWFTETTENADSLDEVRKNKMDSLEQTYGKKLMLSAPADHWKKEEIIHKEKGNLFLGILICLILLSGISLWVILVEAPANIYATWFSSDKSVAVRWTIVYITFIGLIAFAIKQVNKLMFSSYHLARDCQERKLLTNFYLSLLKESAVEKEQQNLIITSLFSRADTGLLKDDGSPSMPTDAIKSMLGK